MQNDKVYISQKRNPMNTVVEKWVGTKENDNKEMPKDRNT